MLIKAHVDDRKVCSGPTTPPALTKHLSDTNADARSVCGS